MSVMKLCLVTALTLLEFAQPFRLTWRGRGEFGDENDFGNMLVTKRRYPTEAEDDDDIIETYSRFKRCSSCYCYQASSNEYFCCECGITETVCFPGMATVTLPSGQRTQMDKLQAGDSVLAVNGAGQVIATKVLMFVHRNPDVGASYLKLSTDSKHHLTLSKTHIVFSSASNSTEEAKPRYAAEVNVGDYLFTAEGENSDLIASRVKSVKSVTRRGAYVPLTETGTLLVNSVYVSVYASFDHDLAHASVAPLRWFPWLLDWSIYIDDVHPYVYVLKTLGRRVLPDRLTAARMLKTKQPATQHSSTNTSVTLQICSHMAPMSHAFTETFRPVAVS